MIPQIATVIFVIGIAGLFLLARDSDAQTSKALWIPVTWLMIAGSRNPDEWLHMSSPMDQGTRYLEGDPLDRAVLFTLIIFGVIVLMGRSRRVGELLRSSAPVLLFFAYCAMSSLWSDYPDVAAKRWIRAVGDLVMVLVILTDPDWVQALKRVLKRVGFVLLPLSVLVIRYFPTLGRGYNAAGTATFWTGVTEDKNGLGMICLIFGLGIIWSFIGVYQQQEEKRRTKRLIAYGTVVLTTLYLLWESNSMTSISCFAMAGFLMLAVGRWRLARKPAVIFLLSAAMVGLSAYVLFSGGGGGMLETLGRNSSLTGRTEVWQVLLPFAQNPIFGSGYESFWLGDRLTQIGALTSNGIQEAHNGYLEIYLNLGWLGITLLALVIAMGFRNVVLAVRKDPDTGKLMLAYFVLALIYNFTEAGFKMMNPVWIFFLLATIAIPKVAFSENPAVLEPDPIYNFAASKPRTGYAFNARHHD